MKQLAAFEGLFGKIRIIERKADGARSYMTGASVQTLVNNDGVSLFGYVNACKILLRPYHKILMLGGGGGSLATMLARKGHRVTVVDIDPIAEQLAKSYFGLDARVRWVTGDARTFPFLNRASYDSIVVDACTAEGTDEHFINPYWLARASTSLNPGGAIFVNLASMESVIGLGRRIAEQVAQLGLYANLLQPDDGWEGNEILQISRFASHISLTMRDIEKRPAEARTYLMSLRSASFRPTPPENLEETFSGA